MRVLLLLCLAGVAVALPAFQYGVADDYSGAKFNAQETADGKVVTGSYQVALHDGRIQTVTYTADHYNGYIADVKYEGTPSYPPVYPEAKPYHPAPKPGYHSKRSAPEYRLLNKPPIIHFPPPPKDVSKYQGLLNGHIAKCQEKAIFLIIKVRKSHKIFFQLSVLASKKRLNKKNAL